MSQSVFFAPADRRALIIPGLAADGEYTFQIRAYRKVDKDIALAGLITSDAASVTYQPSTEVAFNGDITGTIQGRPSIQVVLNLEALASDSVLSTAEKPALVLEYGRVVDQLDKLDAKAATFGTTFNTERLAASNAMDALDAYLATLTPAWDDTSQHTAINPTTFRSLWASLYSTVSTLATAITGLQGPSGLSTAAVFIYKRSATAPTDSPASGATYNFSTGALTGTLNGWTTTIPASDGNPLWVRQASASGTGTTDTILASEWSSPQQVSSDGAAGGNSAVVYIYQRSATAPALPPSNTLTYTFATGVLSGTFNNGWSANIPAANGQALWVRTAVAFSTGTTDTIATGEWSSSVQLVQDGIAGVNAATVFLYQRFALPPSVPTTTATYTFATGVLTGANNGWSQDIPAPDGNPLYVTTAAAISSGTTDTILSAEWAEPVVLAQDGLAGLNNARVMIYRRAATTPTLPSVSSTFTFATGGLTGLNNGWTTAIPAVDGNPLWVSAATASSLNATDVIAAGEWASPVIMAQDGANGLNTAAVFIYQRAASAPAAPSTSATYTFASGAITGLNNGWTATVPAANGQPLWVRQASASSTTATDTITSGEWSTAQQLASDGEAGAAGGNTAVVYIYQRAATSPASPPTNTLTYTFATGVLSGTFNNGWSATIPAADGNPLWVRTAVAFSSAATDTIATGEWSGSVRLAQDGAPGPAGLNNAAVFIYKRAATAPTDAPATGATYTFATGALTGTLNGWTTTIPAADGNPLWVRQASASSTAATDTIATGEWSAVQQLAANGAAGAAGGNSAVVFIYARGATAPAAPTGATTYTFGTAALTGTLGNGWTQAIPAANGQPLWARTAVAFSSGASDTIAAGEWSAASQIAADGEQGDPGPTITLVADSQAFTFTDNVADPTSQTITIQALLTNLTGTVVWSTTPSVTLTGTGNTRTLSLANFGSNRQVVVTATLGGITQTITIVRLERNITAPANANRVPFSRMEGNRGWQATFSSSGLPFTPSFGDFENRRFFSVVTSATAAGQNFNIGGNVRFRVTPGERLSVQARLDVFSPAATGGNWFLRAVFFNAAGTASFATVATGNGPVGASTITAGFVDVPAGQVSMILELGAFSGTSGVWTLAISEPMVTSAVAGQTMHPPFSPGPNSDDGADITAAVSGPVQVALAYNSVGALQTSLPVTETYRLVPRGGVAFSTGVTWSVSVLAGSFTGAAPTITGTGTGQLSLNSDISSSEATLQITASVNGLSYPPMTVKVIKEVAVAFSNPSLDDTLGSPASSVYSVVGEVTITLGNATTAVNLNAAALTLRTSSTNAPAGTSTLEFKWMRETAFNSGVFVDVGAVATSSPDPGLSDPFGDGFLRRDIGSVTCNRTATGLTASTEQRFRLMGRISGGNIRVINVGGTVSVTV